MMKKYIQVSTTTSQLEEAEHLAKELLEKHLVACVQISQITSKYHWQGKIETDDEFLCVMKSREDLFDKLKKAIITIHAYDVPEIVAVPIVAASMDYRNWMDEELADER